MKNVFLPTLLVLSMTLFSFTNNTITKGEKVFEITQTGEVNLLPGQSFKISNDDAYFLAKNLEGWTACETKSVLNQCETRLATFPDEPTDLNAKIQEIIDKYN